MAIKYIPLAGGRVAIVDEADYDSVKDYRWTYNKTTGYVCRWGLNEKTGKKGSIYLHRQIMGFPDCYVDHENGMKTDCRRSNLREATPAQSRQNTRKQKKKALSKYKGVTRNKSSWVAQIWNDYKRIHLGSHKTEEAAAMAYNLKAIELFGEFAEINDVG